MNININLWQSSLQIGFIGVKCGLESLTPDKIRLIVLYAIIKVDTF